MKEKDLIILSMSTLPPIDKLAKNYYVDKDTDQEYEGVSQLEPGTECFINELKGRNLTHIYIINSKKTRAPLSDDVLDKIADYGYLKSEQVNKDGENINTVQFFIERIRKYVHDSNISLNLIDQDDFFIPINLDDENEGGKDTFLYDTIYELCREIRKQTEGGYDIHLFINMVGGRRNDTSIINAVIKMLAIDHINVEKSNTVDFKGNGNTSYIVNTTDSDRILEMVSGMDEFIYTGRGDLLRAFWSNPKNIHGESLLEEEQDIIDQISYISDSISLCAIDNFKDDLINLSKQIQRYERLAVGKTPLFNSFITTLKNDYDQYNLLSNNGSEAIDQVEWCVSKGLYQQALTLVESKMPDAIVNARILHYGNAAELKLFLKQYLNSICFKPSKNNIDWSERSITQGKEEFVFVKNLFSHKKANHTPIPGYNNKERIDIELIPSCNDEIPVFREYKTNRDNPQLDQYNYPEDIPGIERIRELLKTYFILAEARNMVNHGNGDKLILALPEEDNGNEQMSGIQTVKGELEDFIEVYKDVKNNNYHMDYSDIVTIPDFSPELLNSQREEQTFSELPKDEDHIAEFLDGIWTDHTDIIRDFTVINHAILQMDGLSWEQFQRGENTDYYILNQLLEFMINNAPNANNDINEQELERLKRNRFIDKIGRNPHYIRFIKSVQHIKGFYPDHFHHSPEARAMIRLLNKEDLSQEMALSQADAITHGGKFHADDVMATVILGKLYPGLRLIRVNNLPEEYDQNLIVYDIGNGKYDHHQQGANGQRENGVPYAAAGLIWKDFGRILVEDADDPEAVWQLMDQELIQGIDAEDNGVMPGVNYPAECLNLSKMIGLFNSNWDQDVDTNEAFLEAVSFAEQVFDKVYKNVISRLKARDIVESAIEQSENHIMILGQYVPWQYWLFQSQNDKAEAIHYVIYPAVRGGYNCQCVPDEYNGCGQRKPMPVTWRGLKDRELQELTGIASAIFCHQAGFIGGAETSEDAYKMAELAEKI